MSADQFLTVDGRPTVRVERRYPHPIERVWEAVTTPEHLGTNASEGMHHVEMLNPDGGQTTFVSRIEELVPDDESCSRSSSTPTPRRRS